jgi:glycosyltransferase involved in cell wall biosynthesis
MEPIEVLVCDNASDDDTQAVLESWSFLNPLVQFRPFLNPENIGMVRNVYKLAAHSSGDYVLFCTDDDIVLPRGVEQALEVIDRYQPNFAKIGLITYLERSKSAFFYGCKTDQINMGENLEAFSQAFRLSHVFTGCIVNRRSGIFEKAAEIENVYPSAIWCALGLERTYVCAEPFAVHVWENEIFWDLDVDMTSASAKEEHLNRDFQDSLNYLAMDVRDKPGVDNLIETLISSGHRLDPSVRQLLTSRSSYAFRFYVIRFKALNIFKRILSRIERGI